MLLWRRPCYLGHGCQNPSDMAAISWLRSPWRLRLGTRICLACFTPIKWFPDHRGIATGMAIMGFGGGATIGAPLRVALMKYFQSDLSVGVAKTFVVISIL